MNGLVDVLGWWLVGFGGWNLGEDAFFLGDFLEEEEEDY